MLIRIEQRFVSEKFSVPLCLAWIRTSMGAAKKYEAMMTQIYLTRRQVAELYPIAEDTLARLAHQKRGPMFYKPLDKALYKPADIEKWIESAPALQGDGQALASHGQRGRTKTPRAAKPIPPVTSVVAEGVRTRRLKSLPPSSHSALNAK